MVDQEDTALVTPQVNVSRQPVDEMEFLSRITLVNILKTLRVLEKV